MALACVLKPPVDGTVATEGLGGEAGSSTLSAGTCALGAAVRRFNLLSC